MEPPPTATPREQRKFICETVAGLTHQDATAVFRFLSTRLPKGIAFSEHSNGCSINLDALCDELIGQLYNFVLVKAIDELDDGDDGDDAATDEPA